MKAHIGVDADSGLAHTVRGTSGKVNDVVEANSLPHGQESVVFAYAGTRAQTSDLTPMAPSRGMLPCVIGVNFPECAGKTGME